MSGLGQHFKLEVEQSRAARAKVREFARIGRPLDAEYDPMRAAEFVSRQIEKNLPGPEALVGPTNDLQAIWFLVRGALARRAVAFIEVSLPGSSDRGTGFLVGAGLFLTNQHVIADANTARMSRITFDYERDANGLPQPSTIYTLDPDRFALFSPENELDYALVAVGPRVFGSADLSDFGFCPLSNRPDRHAIGMNVNIVQHPSGLPKMVALRNNLLTFRTPRTLLYETDTEHGSSGAPVFNDLWEVIALHHYGEPFLERTDETGAPIPGTVNEGVRISAIYSDLTTRLTALTGEKQALLRTVLDFDNAPPAAPDERRLSPPRPGNDSAERAQKGQGVANAMSDTSQELRITVPLDITIRIGGSAATTSAAATVTSGPPAKSLSRGAEALRVDQNYANRKGYSSRFIPGVEIALPAPSERLARQIAPLNPGQPAAEKGELKYQHFSLKLHKTRRMAVFSATNIDGKTYLAVDRDTGEVRDGAEGDKWFLDPRTQPQFYLDQSFYSDWSHYFDRGHVTRRTDPTWGDEDEAERANADTFHFTNCTPQHFRFNQTAKFWQGAERYVLENGVLSNDSKNRITVFQGPIFNSQIDLMADDVQIPSSFFKVIVWKGRRGLKSVGLVVDQLPLMSETRKKFPPPGDLPSVDVSQWRVPIAAIEQRTGLNFGTAIRDADTIREDQPVVGEAIIAVKSFDDLLPRRA